MPCEAPPRHLPALPIVGYEYVRAALHLAHSAVPATDGGNRTSMPGEGHEDPTEAQIRWQVFQAIAYGARGLLCARGHSLA